MVDEQGLKQTVPEPPDIRKASVQIDGDADKKGSAKYVILQLATAADEAPRWYSPRRDAYLRAFWPTVPFLGSAMYSVAARNAAFRFDVTGPDKPVEFVKRLLTQADLGRGWHSFIMKISIDLLSQDNGAFIEIIRPARVRTSKGLLPAIKSVNEDGETAWFAMWQGEPIEIDQEEYEIKDVPVDQPVGIAHLDAGRCVRTGDAEYPVIYTDLKNKDHKLRWWQVLTLEDMPSPIEDMYGVGTCAITRVMRACQILRDIAIYKHEKVSGRHVKTVWLTNVDHKLISDVIAQSKEQADSEGLMRYMQPIIASTLDPGEVPAVAQIALASLPDGWDEEISMRWFLTELAMGLGVDYGFLAPLPGTGLGTASQSETMVRQSRGKSSRMFMEQMEFKLNYGGVMPKSVTFEFKELDPEEEQWNAEVLRIKAKALHDMVSVGILNGAIARQMLVDDDLMKEEYLKLFDETDVTPISTQDVIEPKEVIANAGKKDLLLPERAEA